MRRLVAILVPLVALGCGGNGENGHDAGSDAGEDSGPWDPPPPGEYGEPCPLDTRIGRFEIAHFDLYSAVTGSVSESVLPVTVLQQREEHEGCRLMQQVNYFCDPACVPGETCDSDETCVPFPARRSVGTVRAAGLAERVVIRPDPVKNYSATGLPHSLFEEGAPIQLWADGDELGGFALDGAGVAELEVPILDWTIASGEDTTIEWVPSDGPGSILVTLNVDAHGQSPVTMFCEVEDTGSLTIPGTFVEVLYSYGFTLPATGFIKRRTVDSAQIDEGCVELEVLSQLRARMTPTPP